MYGRIQETGFFKEEVVNKQNWKTIDRLARMEKRQVREKPSGVSMDGKGP